MSLLLASTPVLVRSMGASLSRRLGDHPRPASMRRPVAAGDRQQRRLVWLLRWRPRALACLACVLERVQPSAVIQIDPICLRDVGRSENVAAALCTRLAATCCNDGVASSNGLIGGAIAAKRVGR